MLIQILETNVPSLVYQAFRGLPIIVGSEPYIESGNGCIDSAMVVHTLRVAAGRCEAGEGVVQDALDAPIGCHASYSRWSAF